MPAKDRDPPIDEVRETRHRISAEVGHDPARIVERYQRMQDQSRDRLLDHRPDQSALPEPAA